MQDLTNLANLCAKVDFFDFSTFRSKSVKSCINSWTDPQVDLSEPIAAHLIYMNPNFHSLSCFIQWDIGLLLKSIEILKSRVVATLLRLSPCLRLHSSLCASLTALVLVKAVWNSASKSCQCCSSVSEVPAATQSMSCHSWSSFHDSIRSPVMYVRAMVTCKYGFFMVSLFWLVSL